MAADHQVQDKSSIFESALIILAWMWSLFASIVNLGPLAGMVFFILNILAILLNPLNGLIFFIMTMYVPIDGLNVGRFRLISMVLTLVGCLVFGRIGQFLKNFFTVYGILVLFTMSYFAFEAIMSPEMMQGLYLYVNYVQGFFGMFFVFCLIRNRNDVVKILKWWVVLAFLSLIISSIHLYLGSNSHLYHKMVSSMMTSSRELALGLEVGLYYTRRFLWPGMEPNYYASYLLFPIGVGLALFEFETHYRKKMLWLFMAICIALGVIATLSRSGFLCACAICLLYGLKKNIKAIIPAIFVAAAFMVMLLMMPAIGERILGIQSQVTEEGASGRFELWAQGFELWRSSPVFGKGLYSYMYNIGRPAHNTYVEVLAETGIVGIVMFGLVIGGTFLAGLRGSRILRTVDSHYSKLVYFMTISTLGAIMMMGTLSFNDVPLFWIEFGLCYICYRLIVTSNYEIDDIEYYYDE